MGVSEGCPHEHWALGAGRAEEQWGEKEPVVGAWEAGGAL